MKTISINNLFKNPHLVKLAVIKKEQLKLRGKFTFSDALELAKHSYEDIYICLDGIGAQKELILKVGYLKYFGLDAFSLLFRTSIYKKAEGLVVTFRFPSIYDYSSTSQTHLITGDLKRYKRFLKDNSERAKRLIIDINPDKTSWASCLSHFHKVKTKQILKLFKNNMIKEKDIEGIYLDSGETSIDRKYNILVKATKYMLANGFKERVLDNIKFSSFWRAYDNKGLTIDKPESI